MIRRCPVDNYVFPGLDRLREGDSLEARFNAFKIPESNFLVFEATVRTCRDGCQPAFCSSGTGRSEPSYGRRKRSAGNGTEIEEDDTSTTTTTTSTSAPLADLSKNETSAEVKDVTEGPEEYVREMIEVNSRLRVRFDHFASLGRFIVLHWSDISAGWQVFDSRYDMNDEEENAVAEKRVAPVVDTVCITPNEYYGLMTAVVVLVVLLASIVLMTVLIYR